MIHKIPFASARHLVVSVATAALIAAAAPASAAPGGVNPAAGQFRHLGTFDVMAGNGSAVAEIVDVTVNNKELVYTDVGRGDPDDAYYISPGIGFVDISNPASPKGLGRVEMPGIPTSLVVLDPLVLVGVDTSPSKVDVSGKLVVVHRHSREIVAEYELGGQPDSLALAPDRKRVAIVLENERDEDANDGLLPQLPSGRLLIVDLRGAPQKWKIAQADLGLVAAAAFEGDDLEPEFVDVNNANLAVVSFQENNHLAVIDLLTGATVSHFAAGSATLTNVDTTEDDLISLDAALEKRREPDAVAWIDHDSFATANEGDYEDENGEAGGSRGFTIFNIDGTVEYESAESFEHWLVRVGHYNEGRSENKGVEPEAVEFGEFGKRKLLFVGSERSNAIGVYDVTNGSPVPDQVLPTGIGPEGLKAIPRRGLLVASTETTTEDPSEDPPVVIGIPTMITIYGLANGPATYPMIESEDDVEGLPIPWVALSGLVADPSDPQVLHGVSDAFLAQGFIYTIDVSEQPAKIVDRLEVSGASASLDLEGIAVGPDGSFWLGSEGTASTRPNLVLKVDASTGSVLAEFELPGTLVDARRSNGIEGIAVTGAVGAETIYVAIQRAWPAEGDLDEINTKIGRLDVATGEWTFVHYPLEPEGAGDWIGLSEITLLPDGSFAVIERDKGWGPTTGFNAELKALYRVELAGADFRPYVQGAPNGGLVSAPVSKTLLRNVLSDIAGHSIWTAEKLEGMAVTTDGQVYVVTDNDGVDGATGGTVFLNLGPLGDL